MRSELPVPKLSARASAALRRALLAWYRRHARDLPWRRTRDPWAIWVSEVMLQQTRVKTALPYYPRFLARFPTPASLAGASEEDVLGWWSGLGYYRRARQLREAAQTVVREHAGVVPGEPGVFGALSGVGRYTRAAVLSIGFGLPLAVLDGNVARVLSRVFALEAAVREPRGARALWALAESLVPVRGAGEWNQALMELGAMVCTPRAPRCGDCPLARACRARAMDRVEKFPPVPARRRTERVRRAVALIECGGRMLMAKRSGALLHGLWEPPGVDLAPGENAGAKLAAELSRLGVRAKLENTGDVVRHTITHRAIEVEVWRGVEPVAVPRKHSARGGTRYVGVKRGSAPLHPRRAGLLGDAVPLTALARKLAR